MAPVHVVRDRQSQATVQGCDQRGRDPCSLSGSRPSGDGLPSATSSYQHRIRQGGRNNGNATRISYDAADNRVRYNASNVIVQISTGQQITSSDGRFRLVQQANGNLVLYFGTSALWASYAFGSNFTTYFQSDGNLVTYSPSGAVWNSRTNAFGARLALQNDGNLVIYDLDDKVVWTTNTGGH